MIHPKLFRAPKSISAVLKNYPNISVLYFVGVDNKNSANIKNLVLQCGFFFKELFNSEHEQEVFLVHFTTAMHCKI